VIALPRNTQSEESRRSLSDRLRFWHTLNGESSLPGTRLTIRKLELDEQALVHCHVEADGRLTILSNDKSYALRFSSDVFLDSPPLFLARKDWTVKGGWANEETTVAFFMATAAGALGWGPKVPQEIDDSTKEALRGIEKRKWKSCVVGTGLRRRLNGRSIWASTTGPVCPRSCSAIMARREGRAPYSFYEMDLFESPRECV
jgi:hypothetical protein